MALSTFPFELISSVQEHMIDGFGLYHDFLVTKGWFIIIDAGARWGSGGVRSLLQTLEWALGQRSTASMITLDERTPARVHLYPRASCTMCDKRVLELDSFFAFHHANAFEDEYNGIITLDTARADTAKLEAGSPADKGGFLVEDIDWDVDVPRTTLTRYVINTASGKYSKRELNTRHSDFPTTAVSRQQERARYIYSTAAASADRVGPVQGVMKTDVRDLNPPELWLPEPHEFCGEVSFVARQRTELPHLGPQEEDDGYLITLLFDGRRLVSTLLVFDAARPLGEGPIARVPLVDPAAPRDASAEGGAEGGALGQRLTAERAALGMASPGMGLHGAWVQGLAPSLAEVQAAEQTRLERGAHFLGDTSPLASELLHSLEERGAPQPPPPSPPEQPQQLATQSGGGAAESGGGGAGADRAQEERTPPPAAIAGGGGNGGGGPGALQNCALFLGGAVVSRLDMWAQRLRARLPGAAPPPDAGSDTTATACERVVEQLRVDFPEAADEPAPRAFPFWRLLGDFPVPAPTLLPRWERLQLPHMLPAGVLSGAASGTTSPAAFSDPPTSQGEAVRAAAGATGARGSLGTEAAFAVGVTVGSVFAVALTLIAMSTRSRLRLRR